jgi:signal peptide peptidase SppA
MREAALAPDFQAAFASALQDLASTTPEAGHARFMATRGDLGQAYGFNPQHQSKPFAFAEGLAIIPIDGALINRFGSSYSGATGFNFIRSQAQAAAADPEVRGIVFDINSYGGEAAGCFECAADLHQIGKSKPTLAVVDSNAYSAGYALASAANSIALTPSGGAGSIGVVTMHVDMSKMLDNFGVNVTLLHSGAHKVDGNPYGPLADDVKAGIQSSLDTSRAAFANMVDTHRYLKAGTAHATEAQTYRADDAMKAGLIDAIATPQVAVQAFLVELSGSKSQPKKGATAMSTKENEPGSTDQAQIDKAAADARTSERARVQGIQSCDEAKGREQMAAHLAFNTSMSVEDAKAMLAVAPKAAAAPAPAPAPAAQGNPFADAMNASKHPNVGSDAAAAAAGGAKGGEEMSAADRILASQAQATGRKL